MSPTAVKDKPPETQTETVHIVILGDDGEAVRELDLPIVGLTYAQMLERVSTSTGIELVGSVVVGGELIEETEELHSRTVEAGRTYELPDP